METGKLDLKSIRSFGFHGAIGLLMGIGAGFFLGFFVPGMIFINILSSSVVNYSTIIQGITIFVTILVIYGIYGLYVGYIFGGQDRSSKMSKTCAVAGIFGGLVTTGLYAGGFITMDAFTGLFLVPLFITLAFTGPVLGFPKIRNMVLVTALSAPGSALSYGIFLIGQNLTVYLNSMVTGGGLYAIFISILFNLLAIGIAGSAVAIGMYYTEGNAFVSRDIPRFLKISRIAGIVLTLLLLFFSGLMFVSAVKYASTGVSIDFSGEGTVLVPVLLEEGDVMEMYRKPSGGAVTEIIDTDHGKALKIIGPAKINMKQNGGILASDPEADEKFVSGFTLSTGNATFYGGMRNEVEVWIYSEKDGQILSLSILRDNGWGKVITIGTEREITLASGWQVVKLTMGRMMYD